MIDSFHGMEEVEGSNPSRSTNNLHRFLADAAIHFRFSKHPNHCAGPSAVSINLSNIACC